VVGDLNDLPTTALLNPLADNRDFAVMESFTAANPFEKNSGLKLPLISFTLGAATKRV
jgi:hypothetical protein